MNKIFCIAALLMSTLISDQGYAQDEQKKLETVHRYSLIVYYKNIKICDTISELYIPEEDARYSAIKNCMTIAAEWAIKNNLTMDLGIKLVNLTLENTKDNCKFTVDHSIQLLKKDSEPESKRKPYLLEETNFLCQVPKLD